MKELFDFPAGVDVVPAQAQNDLEHHLGMVRAAAAFYSFLETLFRPSTRASNHAHWIVGSVHPHLFFMEKALSLVGMVGRKCIFCYSINFYA